MPLQTPDKKYAQMPLDMFLNLQKKAGWSPSEHTPKIIQGAPVGFLENVCPPASRCARGCTAVPPQTRKTPALLPRMTPSPHLPHLTWKRCCRALCPLAVLCAGPHSAPENGLHQIGHGLLELQVPSSSLIPSSGEARPCSGPSCHPHVGRSLCLCPLECPR